MDLSVRADYFWELDTYTVGIQPERQGSGSPPCWYVTYQTSLSLCRCRVGSVYQGHGQEWQLCVNRSLKYFGWLLAGSRSSSPDYLKRDMHPLSLKGRALELSDYPDRIFSKYILDDNTNGFQIGFSNCHTLQPAVTGITLYLTCFKSIISLYGITIL